MDLDLMSARQRKRKDGTIAVVVNEPAPSKVTHLFQPGNPDYEAACGLYEAKLAELDKVRGTFA